jgi:hypothetical protein
VFDVLALRATRTRQIVTKEEILEAFGGDRFVRTLKCADAASFPERWRERFRRYRRWTYRHRSSPRRAATEFC